MIKRYVFWRGDFDLDLEYRVDDGDHDAKFRHTPQHFSIETKKNEKFREREGGRE